MESVPVIDALVAATVGAELTRAETLVRAPRDDSVRVAARTRLRGDDL
jgi:hypothetical protein